MEYVAASEDSSRWLRFFHSTTGVRNDQDVYSVRIYFEGLQCVPELPDPLPQEAQCSVSGILVLLVFV